MTIRELAKYTGFSVATISRVLNNDPTMSVSDATRIKILEAARELHYKPTGSRRSAAHRPLHIAIVEMLSTKEQLQDPYYLYLKDFAEWCCMENGHNISRIYEKDNDYQVLGNVPLDGILAIGIFSERQVEALGKICPRVVFLDSAPNELRFDSVVLNFRLGIESAIDYLVERGHKRIAFLGPSYKLDQLKREAPEVRRQCFISHMQDLELYHDNLLVDTGLTPETTRQAIGDWLSGGSLPTALIAYNEDTAITAVSMLRERSLRVPEDVSVISFNDTPLSVLIDPPLTSVNAHLDSMSKAAVRLLVERIEDPQRLPTKMVVPMTLTERESVAAAR